VDQSAVLINGSADSGSASDTWVFTDSNLSGGSTNPKTFVLNLQTKGSFSRLIIIIIGRNVFVRIVSVRFSFHLRIMFFV
jgi:hypothetical protein